VPEEFEPRVIVFTCNWCGYPAATLTGFQGLQYPSGVRIVRVMCTGRVDPAFMLKSFEYGADGVAVVGCRIGECHFVEGNKKAQRRIEAMRNLLRYLGLGEERIGSEWLSASETRKFANLMNSLVEDIKRLGPNPMPERTEENEIPFHKQVIDDIISDTGAHDCVECGKCTSVCPVAKYDENFAPRLIVLRALEGLAGNLKNEKDIWSCVTCEMCNSMCPYEVDYSEFIRELRTEAQLLGNTPQCPQGGLLQSMMRIMAETRIQDRLGWIPDDIRIAEKGDVLYFTGCLPHMDEVFFERDLNLKETAIGAIRLLNRAGVVPVVSNEEVCCGHDLNWAGDEVNFEKLMNRNLQAIKEAGAKVVVFSCPECLRTFKIDYQDILGDLDFELMHLTEFLMQKVNDGVIDLKVDEGGIVTYHDPCRLGRHLGIYDAPRELLQSSGLEVREMENAREDASCCGVSAWVTCDSSTMKMQLDRLSQAKRTGAGVLLTMCPKCRIHLDCVASNETPVDGSEIDIPIADYTAYLARQVDSK